MQKIVRRELHMLVCDGNPTISVPMTIVAIHTKLDDGLITTKYIEKTIDYPDCKGTA
jgi:hypothetical protein